MIEKRRSTVGNLLRREAEFRRGYAAGIKDAAAERRTAVKLAAALRTLYHHVERWREDGIIPVMLEHEARLYARDALARYDAEVGQ